MKDWFIINIMDNTQPTTAVNLQFQWLDQDNEREGNIISTISCEFQCLEKLLAKLENPLSHHTTYL